MQRNQASSPAFASADSEHAAGQVDIPAGQRQRFADPQSGAGDQPEQRGIAVWPQPAGRRQAGSGLQQIADLTVGIDVRRFAVPDRAEQSRRGHLGGTVQRGQVTQETPHRHQPAGRVARIRRDSRGRPVEARLQQDRAVVPSLVQVPGKGPQRALLTG